MIHQPIAVPLCASIGNSTGFGRDIWYSQPTTIWDIGLKTHWPKLRASLETKVCPGKCHTSNHMPRNQLRCMRRLICPLVQDAFGSAGGLVYLFWSRNSGVDVAPYGRVAVVYCMVLQSFSSWYALLEESWLWTHMVKQTCRKRYLCIDRKQIRWAKKWNLLLTVSEL